MKYFLLAILFTISACSVKVTTTETSEQAKVVMDCFVVEANINAKNARKESYKLKYELATLAEKEAIVELRETNILKLAELEISKQACIESIALNGDGGLDVSDLWQTDS